MEASDTLKVRILSMVLQGFKADRIKVHHLRTMATLTLFLLSSSTSPVVRPASRESPITFLRTITGLRQTNTTITNTQRLSSTSIRTPSTSQAPATRTLAPLSLRRSPSCLSNQCRKSSNQAATSLPFSATLKKTITREYRTLRATHATSLTQVLIRSKYI